MRARVSRVLTQPAFTSIVLRTDRRGFYPYSATVLPLKGQVPSGTTIASTEDPSLRASILSTYPDGSAAVVVVSGFTQMSEFVKIVTLHTVPDTPFLSNETPVQPRIIPKVIDGLRFEFEGIGNVSFDDLHLPDKIWWQNARTLCARYRGRPASHSTLQVIVDIQIWSDGTALMEAQVENSLVNPSAPTKPLPAVYFARVFANGKELQSVNSNRAPEGNHAAFRAWYTHARFGKEAIYAVQSHTDLQKHPLFYKCIRLGNDPSAYAGYAGDVYIPWQAGRHRGVGMGGAGDHPSIGPLTQWDARFLQTGNSHLARAVEANALAILGFNVNYRHSLTHDIPDFKQVVGRSMQINWPVTYGPNDTMSWKVSHHPAAGLMAFVVRPSPVYIEIAQKIALWNGTWSTWGGTPTGVFGRPYQLRGKAWCMRSLAHAVFLTPDNLSWKKAGLESLALNVNHLNQYRTSPLDRLNFIWEDLPNLPRSTFNWVDGHAAPIWQHHYMTVELHKIASVGILSGQDQQTVEGLADWAATQAVRWVNEQPNGAWRYVPYGNVVGRNATTIDSMPTWDQQQATWMLDVPPSVKGNWMSTETVSNRLYSAYSRNGLAGAYYPSYFWSALVAAVERNVQGSQQAWQTVQANVDNLDQWCNGFGNDPRWGSTPRVVQENRRGM